MLHPMTEADLSDAIRAAKGPLKIVGGGTRPIGRPVVGETLSTAGLAGITLYDPGALTMVVRAGTPLAEVEAALAAEGQRLPFEPMDHRPLLGTSGSPTIGAVAAMNNSGPRRILAGAARDHMLGVRYVDGAGGIIKNGGRVMKNVTGYDLVKLMAGSFGTLGVLSEVALKVLPTPETQATLALSVPDAAAGVAAMSAALGSPYEVSGAAFGPFEGATAAGPVYLRVEGFAASVSYRVGRLRDLLRGRGDLSVLDNPAASVDLWRGIRDVTAFADNAAVLRVALQPSRLADVQAAAIRAGLRCQMLADWGGGLLWVSARDDDLHHNANGQPDEDATLAGAQRLLAHFQAHAARNGGHATMVKAPIGLRTRAAMFQPEAAPLAALSAGLRAKFDPRGLLNPGLMT